MPTRRPVPLQPGRCGFRCVARGSRRQPRRRMVRMNGWTGDGSPLPYHRLRPNGSQDTGDPGAGSPVTGRRSQRPLPAPCGCPDTGGSKSGCPAIGRDGPWRVTGCPDTGIVSGAGSLAIGAETPWERPADQTLIDPPTPVGEQTVLATESSDHHVNMAADRAWAELGTSSRIRRPLPGWHRTTVSQGVALQTPTALRVLQGRCSRRSFLAGAATAGAPRLAQTPA